MSLEKIFEAVKVKEERLKVIFNEVEKLLEPEIAQSFKKMSFNCAALILSMSRGEKWSLSDLFLFSKILEKHIEVEIDFVNSLLQQGIPPEEGIFQENFNHLNAQDSDDYIKDSAELFNWFNDDEPTEKDDEGENL